MHQVAALPYRISGNAGRNIEVLLVTSFRSKRWIIPKGDVDGGMAPSTAAEKEALEEAGVRGRIAECSIGSFRYDKERNGVSSEMLVDVYPLEVSEQLTDWQEMKDRERQWLPIDTAADVVREPQLQELIRRFEPDTA